MSLDPRDEQLGAVVAEIVVSLIHAHAAGDAAAVCGQLAKLLGAVAAHGNTLGDRRADDALLRAIRQRKG